MPVDNIRLSQKAKDSLVQLKRTTHIENWNVFCRWAFCLSVRESSSPPQMNHPADSNVELSWRIFAGDYGDVYWALLKQRCVRDGTGESEDELNTQFRLHLHRGIAYLSSNPRGIDQL